MSNYGVATGRARRPGIRHQYRFSNLWINRRGVIVPMIGATPARNGDVDMYRLTTVSGFRDGEVRDAREVLAGADGEEPLSSLAGGRPIILEGFIDAGSIPRIEDMDQALGEAFFARTENPMQCHDPRQDVYDDFSQNTISDYSIDSGAGTLSISGGEMVPTSTAAKRLRFTGRPTSYLNGVVTRKIVTGTSIAGGVWRIGLRMDPGGADTGLFAQFSDADPGLRVIKIVSGTATSLASTSPVFNPAVSTAYWLRLIVSGDALTAELWGSDPLPGVAPSSLLAVAGPYTLTEAEQATFASPGHAGWRDSPAHVSERYDDFTVEDWTSDVVVNCRKVASLPGTDQQVDGRYRRPFQVSLKASNPDLVSPWVRYASKTLTGTPPVTALEEFSRQNWVPTNTSDGHFRDDSAYWSLASDLALVGITQNSKYVARRDLSPTVLAKDDFASKSVGNLDGQFLEVGSGSWDGAGDTTDFFIEMPAVGDNDYVVRSALSDASFAAGRWMIAGTGVYATCGVQIAMKSMSAAPDAYSTVYWGVVARYTDTNNNITAVVTRAFGASVANVIVIKRVSSVQTTIGSGFISLPVGYVDIKVRLEVDQTGAWAVYAGPSDQAFPGTPIASGKDAVLAAGGALDDGGVGFMESNTGAVANIRYYDSFQADSAGQEFLTGWARFYDTITSSHPTIGNGTHSAILNFIFTGQPIDVDHTLADAAVYMILKSTRASNRYIALKVVPTLVGGPEWVVEMSLVKFESGSETVLSGPTTIWSRSADDGVDPPPIMLEVDFSGNVVTCSGTPLEDGASTASFPYTLTSTNATNYGSAVEGETGIRISQAMIDGSRPRLDSIDRWTAEEVIVTPQTLAVAPGGNWLSLPVVKLTGPLAAGSYLVARDSGDFEVGRIVLAKDVAAGKVITVDSQTGRIVDEDDVNATGYVSMISDDIQLICGEQNELEFIGSYASGTSKFEVLYREVYR
jgi:hypothetical protein